MQNKRKENSVRSLVNLYTVVIGVALSLSVVSLIDVNKTPRRFIPICIALYRFYFNFISILPWRTKASG